MKLVTAVKADVSHVPSPPQRLATLDDLGIGELLTWLDISTSNPLNVLSRSANARRRLSGVQAHVLRAGLPPKSVFELKQLPQRQTDEEDSKQEPSPLHWDSATRVFVDGPPLALASMAQALNELVAEQRISDLEAQLRLIALACEFCGSYARDPRNPRVGICHYDAPGTCNRFVTPAELCDALKDLQSAFGLVRARRAAKYALDFSGSPMETYIDLGLFLPPRLAGLSLHKPLLNQQLAVSDEVRGRLRHKSLRPDMHWPDQQLLGEYFGDQEHAAKDARVEDKNRLQDYATAGYSPVLLMYDDVRNVTQLNRTAEKLARMLMERGVSGELYRIRRIMRAEGFVAKQHVLTKALLPPLDRYKDA